MSETLEFASARLGIRSPAQLGGPIAHCDVTPVPFFSHWAGEPTSRHAAKSPSRRAAERRARARQENVPTSSALDLITIPDAPRECGVPTPPRSTFRLLSSPAHSKCLAIRSGQSHPGLQSQPSPARHQLKSHRLGHAIRRPGRCGRVRAVRKSPSDIAACHRAVRRHTFSPVTRRSAQATQQARAAPGAHVGHQTKHNYDGARLEDVGWD